jgi:signal peptidase I
VRGNIVSVTTAQCTALTITSVTINPTTVPSGSNPR